MGKERVHVIGHAQFKANRVLSEAWLTNEQSIDRYIDLDMAYAPLRRKEHRQFAGFTRTPRVLQTAVFIPR